MSKGQKKKKKILLDSRRLRNQTLLNLVSYPVESFNNVFKDTDNERAQMKKGAQGH